jgi:hypothetical protein
MDNEVVPYTSSVKEIEEQTGIAFPQETESGISAFKKLAKRVKSIQSPRGESWDNVQFCSERSTIASMNETVGRIFQLLTKATAELPLAAEDSENADDGTA